MRKLAGPSAAWDLQALLLRRIDLHLSGANWQRGGGKGAKPKPVPLPDEQTKQGNGRPKPSGAEGMRRLQNLGLLNADGTPTQPALPPAGAPVE
jgi:hypothetical protein